MCGRFSLSIDNILELANRFHVPPSDFNLQPRYNLAPSQTTLTIINWQGQPQFIPMQWGLLPYWSQKSQKPRTLVNVRSENLLEKPIFKPYFERKRCLIPADGFYEWKTEGKKKIPFRAVIKNQNIFAFAGLWDIAKDRQGLPIHCFTILTTEANPLLASIHPRMPVVLTLEAEEQWLDPNIRLPEKLHRLLKPFPASRMTIFEVSSQVNSTQHDTPECLTPLHS